MLTRRLGASGLTTSRLGLGTMAWGGRTPPEDAADLLAAFRSAGGTLLDTAHGYGGGAAEELIGDLVVGADRSEMVLVTTSGLGTDPARRPVDCSRRTLMSQLDRSLDRMRTDHVDVWLTQAWDPLTPVEETVGALVWAVESGRARYVGVSNHVGWQLARTMTLLAEAGVPLVADSVEYSLVERSAETGLVDAADHCGVGLLPWSPLGRGVLAEIGRAHV